MEESTGQPYLYWGGAAPVLLGLGKISEGCWHRQGLAGDSQYARTDLLDHLPAGGSLAELPV